DAAAVAPGDAAAADRGVEEGIRRHAAARVVPSRASAPRSCSLDMDRTGPAQCRRSVGRWYRSLLRTPGVCASRKSADEGPARTRRGRLPLTRVTRIT